MERKKRLDFTHRVNHLSFGNSNSRDKIQNVYRENMKGELDGKVTNHGEM